MRLLPTLMALLLAGLATACDPGFPGSGPEPTISEEAFIEATVELRRSAAREGWTQTPGSVRDEILAARGLSEEDLVVFVETHGPNVPLMTRIWTEIEARLTGQAAEDLELDEDDLDTIPGLEPDPLNPELDAGPGRDLDPGD